MVKQKYVSEITPIDSSKGILAIRNGRGPGIYFTHSLRALASITSGDLPMVVGRSELAVALRPHNPAIGPGQILENLAYTVFKEVNPNFPPKDSKESPRPDDMAIFWTYNSYKHEASTAAEKVLSGKSNGSAFSDARKAVGAYDSSKEYEELILDEHKNLVYAVANNFHVSSAQRDNLIALGEDALIDAVKKFDPNRGWRFSTYGFNVVHRRLLSKGIRKESRRIHTVEYKEPFPHRRLASDETGLMLERLDLVLDPKTNPAGLTPAERFIIEQRFLNLKPKSNLSNPSNPVPTLEEIAEGCFGLTKERVRQIEKEALRKLREYFTVQEAKYSR